MIMRRIAGEMRRIFRRSGVEEYSVIANRIAPMFNKKSVTKEAAVYGLKKERRDCKVDQRSKEA
jgi:hypothetical protein